MMGELHGMQRRGKNGKGRGIGKYQGGHKNVDSIHGHIGGAEEEGGTEGEKYTLL